MKVNLPEKLYYNIGEVAKAFDVNTSLIRFWEGEFDSIKPKKNKKGNRKFTQKDIEQLELIYFLVKEKGYTLDGAKQHLKHKASLELSKYDLIKRLKHVKSELEEIKKEL
jgi:DNA-binding transcriptional MerR regulator